MRVILRYIYSAVIAILLFAASPNSAWASSVVPANGEVLDRAIDLFNNAQYNEAFSMFSDYIQSSESLNEESDEQRLVQAYYYYGSIHTIYNDYPIALEIFTKGRALASKIGDIEMIFKLTNNMIGAYCSIQRTHEAERLNEELRNLRGVEKGKLAFYYYFNKGYIAGYRGDSEAMSQWMNKAIEAVDKYNLPKTQKVYPYSELCSYYEKRGSLDSAVSVLNKYDSLLTEFNKPYLYLDCYKQLMRIYTKMGDQKNALYYQDKYFQYTDSLLNVNEFAKVKSGYQSFQKRLTKDEIDGLRKTNFYQTTALVLLIVIMIGALVAIVIILRQKRALKEAYQALYERNRELLDRNGAMMPEPRTKMVMAEDESNAENECSDEADEAVSEEPERHSSTITQSSHNYLLSRIEEAMQDESVFCNPDFSMASLAKMIDSNTNYVSQIINTTYNKNFRTFVNEYRVHTAMKRLMDDDQYANYSIQGISESVGYKSTSNFIAAFKKVTGMTPSIYQKIAREDA